MKTSEIKEMTTPEIVERLQVEKENLVRLKLNHAFRLQYCICYENSQHTWWNNNFGQNYVCSHKALSILILNLHVTSDGNIFFCSYSCNFETMSKVLS